MQFKNFLAAAALAASASALPTAQQETQAVDSTIAVGVVQCPGPPNQNVEVPMSIQAAAAPATNLKTFGLMATKPGAAFDNKRLVARLGGLSIGSKQDANCYDKTSEFATFQLNVETKEMFMFNSTDVNKQQFWTDRSGMGRGLLKYSNGVDTAYPKNSETKGFAITESGSLQFEGADFLACPFNDMWEVSIDVGVLDPFMSGTSCTSFIATVVPTNDPIGCLYSN